MRPRPEAPKRPRPPEVPAKLFTQVIEAARPHILRLWQEGDRFFPKTGVRCDKEILHSPSIGRAYYQCNPHFWQCFWQGGVKKDPSLEIDVFGQKYHLVARPLSNERFYELYHRKEPGLNLQYGVLVEVGIQEIPGLSQAMILADSCRDTYLPQRIYGYGKMTSAKDEGFIWDNFGRDLFLDKFYVTNRQVNEWKILTGQKDSLQKDPRSWPLPAFLKRDDQIRYCHFYGKRLLEAKLFDAATMSPTDLKNTRPKKVARPATPWQRDHAKTFLGMAKINPDYQLTPLDCQLAQVQGCHDKYFSTDSASWMGFHFALGFYPESLANSIESNKNLKMSSKFLSAASHWHELGSLSSWDGEQKESMPVAFRCYEEVVP